MSFPLLFEYVDEKVLMDLKRELPEIETTLEVKEVNDYCGPFEILDRSFNPFKTLKLLEDILTDIQIISSNSVDLTIFAIFQQLEANCQLKRKIFAESKTFINKKLRKIIFETLKNTESIAIVLKFEAESEEIVLTLKKDIQEND